MKFSAASVFAMAAVASAQSLADIPACALPCLTKSVESKTKCSATDTVCLCQPDNISAVQSDATSCVLSACGAAKAADVLTAVQNLCKSAGSSSQAGSSTQAASSSQAGSSSQAPTTVQTTQSSGPTQSKASTTPAPTTTASGNGTAPHSSVTAGAAGFAPLAGAAMLAAAMAL